jgi:hypothetical protein
MLPRDGTATIQDYHFLMLGEELRRLDVNRFLLRRPNVRSPARVANIRFEMS